MIKPPPISREKTQDEYVLYPETYPGRPKGLDLVIAHLRKAFPGHLVTTAGKAHLFEVFILHQSTPAVLYDRASLYRTMRESDKGIVGPHRYFHAKTREAMLSLLKGFLNTLKVKS